MPWLAALMRFCLFSILSGLAPAGAAEPAAADPRQTWQMLDYIAVDYAGAGSGIGHRPTWRAPGRDCAIAPIWPAACIRLDQLAAETRQAEIGQKRPVMVNRNRLKANINNQAGELPEA